MIIDFHTHAFPDNIADKATSSNYIVPVLNGSYKQLLSSMSDSNIDMSVILPICTKEGMHIKLNENAAQISQICNDTRLLSFGSVLPGEPGWDKALERAKELGLKGIKLQPSFQNCKLSDESIYELIKYASIIGLHVLVHVGPDYPALEYETSTPVMAYNLINRLDDCSHLILAHLGGFNHPKDALEYIAGSDVYLDTAMCSSTMGLEMMYKIIEKHSPDKILFGTDSPWYSQKKAIEEIYRLDLPQDIMDKIFYKNALNIIG